MRADDRERGEAFCLVAADAGEDRFAALERHFRGSAVAVLRERRRGDRRRGARRAPASGAAVRDRRRVRNPAGRRVDERRRTLVASRHPPLPPGLRIPRAQIAFAAPCADDRRRVEAADTLRLVVRFQLGERDAFKVLYERHFDRVFRYLVTVLHDSHEAEDAAQDVFISALRALRRFEFRGRPFDAWLFRIARNRALDLKRRSRPVTPADPASIDLWRDQRDQGVATHGGEDLLALIERLPSAQRHVIVLRYMVGLDARDIAPVLGRSTGAVRQLEHRALATLRRRLVTGKPAPASRTRAMPMLRLVRASPVATRRRLALVAGARAA